MGSCLSYRISVAVQGRGQVQWIMAGGIVPLPHIEEPFRFLSSPGFNNPREIEDLMVFSSLRSEDPRDP
jgi:hypothetical protein